jgi:citrate lyase subunit beta/citryl-CoA lyase
MNPYPRRRSSLTVPGGSEKMLLKAVDLPADEIIFDLEDGVAPASKPAARQMVIAAIGSGRFADRLVAVRTNAIGTPWCHEDIIAVGGTGHPSLSIVLPKAESAADIGFAERLLLGVGAATVRQAPVGLQALIETAAGLAACTTIAAASSRLQALVLGYADLASSLGRSSAADWGPARDMLLLAARASGKQAIDGPTFDLTPGAKQVGDDALHASALGFDGKWAIHPAQLEAINQAFTPDAQQVGRARAILDALDAARSRGEGVAVFEGAMIDDAMRAGAMRILGKVGSGR